MQEGDPAPKFDKKPKTDELMEAIRFKGRQGTAKAVRNTHMHTLVARIRCLLRSVLGKRECSRVCLWVQAWPWSPFDEMDAYQGGGGGGGGGAAEPEEEVSDSSPSRLHSLLLAQY